MAWTKEQWVENYLNNLDAVRQISAVTDWEHLKNTYVMDRDGDPSEKIRLWPDDHPHAPIVVPDPDPDEFDAAGVSVASSSYGGRRLKAFEEYRVERQRNALTDGNNTAYVTAKEFDTHFVWNDETGTYFNDHVKGVVQYIFDAKALTQAWWKNDREFAEPAPHMDPSVAPPFKYKNWIRVDGKYNMPKHLVLMDSYDEDYGRQIKNDDISVEKAVEIAKEALDIALHDAGLAGWDDFGGS